MNLANGILTIDKSTLSNNLKGQGTLAVDLNSPTTDFAFNSSKNFNDFKGTLNMLSGNINLDNATNNSVLSHAGLTLGSAGQATVSSTTTISNLTLNDGTLVLDINAAAGDSLTVNNLSATSGSTVKVNVLDVIDTSINTNNQNFYDYNSSDSAKQHQLVSATGTVATGQLNITKLDGSSYSNAESVDIVDSFGVTNGQAIFDNIVTAIKDGNDAGLYLGYTLTELSANSGKSITLDSSGASSTGDKTLTAKLTGDGGFAFSGNQSTTLSNSNSDYKGDTVISNTNIAMGSDNAFGQTSSLTLTGNATVDMNGKSQTVGDLVASDSSTAINLGQLTVNQTSDTEFVGTLTGDGHLIKKSTGTLTLSNSNDHVGGLTINGGKVITAHSKALSSGDITVVDGATLHLEFTDSVNNTVANKLTGAGTIIKAHADDLTLSGDNADFSGKLSINNGTITATNSKVLGTSEVNIGSGNELKLSFDSEVNNILTGSGHFNLNNQSINYTGTSINFTGKTTVTQKLSLNGELGDSTNQSAEMYITNGGTLGGNGTFHGNVNAFGGIISADNSIDHLTINGDMTLDSASYFDVEVNPSDENESDLVSVTGMATLGNATVRHIGLGEKLDYSLDGSSWTILRANAINGTFSGVESTFAMLKAELEYSATGDVIMKLTRSAGFDSFARTYNQHSVAGALTSLPTTSKVYLAMERIGTDDEMRNGYDLLFGEIHAGLHGALMNNDRRFAGTMLDHLSSSSFKTQMRNETVTSELDSKNYFWLTGDGYRSETNKTHGNAKAVLKGGGIQMGGEVELDNITFGGAFGYGDGDYKLDSRNSKADITTFKFGGYGAYEQDNWRIKAGASYGWHQIDSSRNVDVGSLNERVKADYDVHTVQLFGEVANRGLFFNSDKTVIEPYVGLGFNLSHNQSFKEKGGNTALDAKAENNSNLNSTVGSRLYYQPTANVSLGADINWQHIYGERHTKNRFTMDGSDSFTIQGAPLDRDSFGAKLEAGVQITPAVNLKAGYQGRFGNNSSYNGGFISMKIGF